MEIAMLSPHTLRIKGKKSSIVIDPNLLKTKTDAEVITIFDKITDSDTNKVSDARLTIKGPGDYEISGVRILCFKAGGHLVYGMQIDGLRVLLVPLDAVSKIKDKISDYTVIIFLANSKLDAEDVVSLEPRIALFYGPNAKEAIQSFGNVSEEQGKISAVALSKFSVTSDKLPDKMQTVWLSA